MEELDGAELGQRVCPRLREEELRLLWELLRLVRWEVLHGSAAEPRLVGGCHPIDRL